MASGVSFQTNATHQNLQSARSGAAKAVLESREADSLSDERPGVQFKLFVGSPDDPSERDADDVADQNMRMPAEVFNHSSPSHPGSEHGSIQRKPLITRTAPFIQVVSKNLTLLLSSAYPLQVNGNGNVF